MKKTFLVAASLFLMIGATKAQKVHFGLKAGMNASSLTNMGPSETKIGFNAGVLAHIHTNNKNWGIQPELIYSVEGAKTPLLGGNNKSNLNLGYLNVPILVQYMFDNGFRLEAGPQFGFLMSAKSKVSGGSNNDVKGSFNNTNISIPVGVGYLTTYGLGFDARYNFGLSDVYKGSGNQKANTFQFGLFYQFSDSKMK